MTHYRSPCGRAFTLREAASFEELDACIALQQQTWGYADIEVVPRNLFVLAQTLGGHVACAWDQQGTLAGFAMAIPAHEVGLPPRPYLHSHMLAVAPAHRDRGLGFALKQWQREDALRRGITLMRWTFDPLVAKNAFFNLERLGAGAREYLPNFYGRRGALPTDRLLAEWRLDGREPVHEPALRVALPGSGERAQALLRARLRKAFAEGWAATGFRPGPNGGGEYLLSHPSHPPKPGIEMAALETGFAGRLRTTTSRRADPQ